MAHVDAATASAIIAGRPYLTAIAFDAKLAEASLSVEQRADVRVELFVPINLNHRQRRGNEAGAGCRGLARYFIIEP